VDRFPKAFLLMFLVDVVVQALAKDVAVCLLNKVMLAQDKVAVDRTPVLEPLQLRRVLPALLPCRL
jgi:hypothetical protein